MHTMKAEMFVVTYVDGKSFVLVSVNLHTLSLWKGFGGLLSVVPCDQLVEEIWRRQACYTIQYNFIA